MRTTDEIYAALTEEMTRRSGAAVAEGGDMSLRLRAVATEIFTLEAQSDFVARQSFPQTAVGEYLDRHAQLRGLERSAGTKAAGQLRFYRSGTGSGISVPAGTRCRTAAGVSFVTTAAGTIPADGEECTVAAEAENVGSGGNVAADTVCLVVLPPVGVSGVTNDSAFSGGSDEESDARLRERVMASYRSLPNGANAAYYRSAVLAQPGVAAVAVTPRARGIGTVDVVFSTRDGVPTAEQITAVQQMLNGERELCVDVLVSAPETAAVNVAAALTVDGGKDRAAVLAAAEAAMAEYFDGTLLGRPVFRAALIARLMAVDGVANCVLTAPAADLPGADGVLPVAGSIAISEAV